MRRRHDPVLLWLTLAWLIPALVLSAIELASSGRLSPLAIALDAIAAMFLPFGVLYVALAPGDDPGDLPPSDGGSDGGLGGRPRWPQPLPPSGEPEIDWDRFQTDLEAWSERRRVGT